MLNVSPRDLPQKERGTAISQSVFQTVAYADVFDYPLTASEVYRYLTPPTGSFEDVIQVLTDEVLFTRVGDYFALRGREEIVETRRRRAKVAARLWVKASRYGRILASLPFVRMVSVTGSLAMNNADEGKDVDYMLVTHPKRLWTSRALSLLVARFARLEGVRICPNYLVTTNALRLSERSLYVAHELAQMIPLSGMEVYWEMLRLNGWIYDYLPNAVSPHESLNSTERGNRQPLIQRILERIFSLPFGDWLEKWEMDRKIKRLSQEQASSVESYFSADVCKGHIDRHGKRIVTALDVRLEKAKII